MMNKESSRSHAIFTFYLTNKTEDDFGVEVVTKSCFHMVDLAGSERQKSANTLGQGTKEAGNINRSLMVLGLVIKGLVEISEGKKRFLHYRDSKLTHFLRDSLGGNSRTAIVANVSPAFENSQETISTLHFAQNAQKVRNKARINEISQEQMSLKEENEMLKRKIVKLNDKLAEFESNINICSCSVIMGTKNRTVKQELRKLNDEAYEVELCATLDEVKNQNKKIMSLEVEVEDLRSKIDFKAIELKTANNQLNDLKKFSDRLDNLLKIKEEEVKKESKKALRFEEEVWKLQQEMEVSSANLRSKIDNLTCDIEKKEVQCNEKEKLLAEVKEKHVLLKNEIALKNEKIDEMRRKWEFQEGEKERLIEENGQLKAKFDFLNSEIDELKGEVKYLNEEKENLKSKKDMLQAKSSEFMHKYEKSMHIAEASIKTLKEEKKSLEQSLERHKKQVLTLHSDNNSYVRTIEEL